MPFYVPMLSPTLVFDGDVIIHQHNNKTAGFVEFLLTKPGEVGRGVPPNEVAKQAALSFHFKDPRSIEILIRELSALHESMKAAEEKPPRKSKRHKQSDDATSGVIA